MNAEEIIKELRRCGLSNGAALGRHMGIMDIAADKLAALNEFQGSQCEKLLVQLADARARIAELEKQHQVDKVALCAMCKARGQEQNLICGCASCHYGMEEKEE